jgi:hypothetical protein
LATLVELETYSRRWFFTFFPTVLYIEKFVTPDEISFFNAANIRIGTKSKIISTGGMT